jgi:hypothetical protein
MLIQNVSRPFFRIPLKPAPLALLISGDAIPASVSLKSLSDSQLRASGSGIPTKLLFIGLDGLFSQWLKARILSRSSFEDLFDSTILERMKAQDRHPSPRLDFKYNMAQ